MVSELNRQYFPLARINRRSGDFISMPVVPTNVMLLLTASKVSWTPPIDIDIDGYYVTGGGGAGQSASIQPSSWRSIRIQKQTSKIVMEGRVYKV